MCIFNTPIKDNTFEILQQFDMEKITKIILKGGLKCEPSSHSDTLSVCVQTDKNPIPQHRNKWTNNDDN